jgi:hypothetical protein
VLHEVASSRGFQAHAPADGISVVVAISAYHPHARISGELSRATLSAPPKWAFSSVLAHNMYHTATVFYTSSVITTIVAMVVFFQKLNARMCFITFSIAQPQFRAGLQHEDELSWRGGVVLWQVEPALGPTWYCIV